jgi:hypothetical protein
MSSWWWNWGDLGDTTPGGLDGVLLLEDGSGLRLEDNSGDLELEQQG